jgi:signal peptidase I
MHRQILVRTGTAIMWMAVLLCLLFSAALGYAKMCGYEVLSVQSDSMEPAIATGDAVLVERGLRLPHAGDVVSYTSVSNPRLVLTHRVIAMDGKRGTFIAQGDNTVSPDPEAPLRTIIGRVRYQVPYAGSVLDLFRHPAGLALAVYLPAAGIVASEARRLSQYFSGLNSGHYVHHRYIRQ